MLEERKDKLNNIKKKQKQKINLLKQEQEELSVDLKHL
jgi:hypothetical protein